MAEGEWIIGRGYDQNTLAEGRHPTRADLDQVGGGRPVVLRHTSGHALTANSRALELAGITASTKTPDGGDIERDEHGEPTGVLKESAMDLLEDAVPAPSRQEGAEAIVRAMDVMASQGITSASDAATGSGASIDAELSMYRAAMDSGRLAGRITLMPQVAYVAPPGSDEIHGPGDFDLGGRPDWLQIGPVKIFSDGAITTRTAALCDPYADSADNRGILIWEPEVLENLIVRSHSAGWQIATHAIGDRAIELVLDCYEKALQAAPRGDHRHRIEHCMLLPPALATRMQQLGVVPVVQPGFIGRLGDAYISALGMERASQLMPMERFDWLGITPAFSSDRPVIPGAPLKGIRSAMQRMTPSGVTLGREHAISALEGIRHYTTGSAYATRTEDRKGRLTRGMLADFTVLSHDPANTSP
jgi:predicted amidohydrolase YtcJ